jgi:hypothetical protein
MEWQRVTVSLADQRSDRGHAPSRLGSIRLPTKSRLYGHDECEVQLVTE